MGIGLSLLTDGVSFYTVDYNGTMKPVSESHHHHNKLSKSWFQLMWTKSNWRYSHRFLTFTVNIHTHFIGTLSLIYLLCFLWPTTPHTNPESSTLTDRLISFIFVICAIKCLVCSTAWHLFAGCGTLGPFRRLACVDCEFGFPFFWYHRRSNRHSSSTFLWSDVGISGLIAASVASAEV